jgi:RNA polymerase sigma-70 factor, ECF subfamily
MDHTRLLNDAVSGDEGAFVNLLDDLEQPVFAYFRQRRVSRANAEDLTQQVFMTLLERAERFDARLGTVRAFVFGIARRLWLKHLERSRNTPLTLTTDVPDTRGHQESSLPEIAERRELVAQAIADLPDAMRGVLTLRMHQGLSLTEIAEVLAMPLNTVKSHLFRARNKVRQQIASKMENSEGGRNAM